MDVLTVATEIHGRVLVERAAAAHPDGAKRWLIAFHGYGQSADDVLAEVMKVPGIDRWNVAAPQALSRFYTRRDEKVVASWMTRQDREQVIQDNVAYVDRVVATLVTSDDILVFVGFSQGAAMAYRAAKLGRRQAAGVIAVCGDVPPELKVAATGGPAAIRPWPAVLIGAGREDQWYTPARCDEDARALRAEQVDVDVSLFDGGHEWKTEFCEAAARWLAGRQV